MAATRNVLGAIATAGATVVAWWAWLGWDTSYQVDPVTQVESGPYEAWQIIGCVLTLAGIAVVASLVLLPVLVVPAMTVAFTAGWSVRAATADDTGLWLVGAIGVFAGMAVGTTVLSVPVWAIRRSRRNRPQGTTHAG